jgi:hypothetical protein
MAIVAVVVVVAAAGYWWMNRPLGRYKLDNSGLYPININGKYGFMDRSGKTVITPQFDGVFGFSEGLAYVRVGTKYGYINTKGVLVITPQFDDAMPFRYGRAAVKLCCGFWFPQKPGDRYGFIDKDGKYICSPDFSWVGQFSGDLAPVRTAGGVIAFVNRSGKVVMSGKFDNLRPTGFTAGLAPAASNGKWGFIDTTGKWVIDPQFENALDFADGPAPVMVGGRWGYIDQKGTFVVNPQYDSGGEFFEGLAVFRQGDKLGLIDTKGRVVVDAKFLLFGQFSEGLAPVQTEDGWGFIDRTGKMVVSPQFDSANSFQNGLARVTALGKEAYITTAGAFVVNPFPGTTIAKESARLAAEALQAQIDAATAAGAFYLKEFLGTWTDKDNFYLLELSYVNGRIRIRQCYGADATEGTEFFGRYSDGTITAIGQERDFYKFQFPEFKVLPTGELLHTCGACGPDGLKRTTKQMPKIPFKPPVNRD